MAAPLEETRFLIELASYSLAFPLSVPSSATVLDLKHEISRACPGAPKVHGQRIIWKGRVVPDGERVGRVWDEPIEHKIHLAVHPTAWTTTPPTSPPRTAAAPLPPPPSVPQLPLPPVQLPTPPVLRLSEPMPYIQHIHANALRLLLGLPPLRWPDNGLDRAREEAKKAVEARGFAWPPVLDDESKISLAPREDGGLRYGTAVIDNLPYLKLLTPEAVPTASQHLALEALTYSLPLLSVTPMPPLYSSQSLLFTPQQAPHHRHHQEELQRLVAQAQQLRQQLRRLGDAPPIPDGLRVPIGGGAGAPNLAAAGGRLGPVQHLNNLRPLLQPLVILTIRTSLLLYFFSPMRTPLWGAFIACWVAWEIWGAVRELPNNAMGGANVRENGNQNPALPNQNANQNAIANNAPQAPQRLPVIDQLAQVNLQQETNQLFPPEDVQGPIHVDVSLVHKAKTFFSLMFLTLHPALWDRRRTALRAREGRVREVFGHDDERREGEPERRPVPPGMIGEYVQRVRRGVGYDE